MLGPLDIHHHLLAHDVHHEIVRLPRHIPNADQLATVLGVAPQRCIDVRPFQARTPHSRSGSTDALVLVLSPFDVELDDAETGAALASLLRAELGPGVELLPAGSDMVSSRTGYLAGHLAALLLPPEVIVVATQRVVDLADSIVYTATGDGGTALGIRASDLLALSGARLLPDRLGVARVATVTLDPPAPVPARSVATAS